MPNHTSQTEISSHIPRQNTKKLVTGYLGQQIDCTEEVERSPLDRPQPYI
jgi:hypothetical protein